MEPLRALAVGGAQLCLTAQPERPLYAAMFGFSFTKLLVLAAILFAVVYGFKMIARASAPQRRASDDSDPANHIDTVYDPKTDSYVPKGSQDKSNKN